MSTTATTTYTITHWETRDNCGGSYIATFDSRDAAEDYIAETLTGIAANEPNHLARICAVPMAGDSEYRPVTPSQLIASCGMESVIDELYGSGAGRVADLRAHVDAGLAAHTEPRNLGVTAQLIAGRLERLEAAGMIAPTGTDWYYTIDWAAVHAATIG